MKDSYNTIARSGIGRYKEKGSKFIGYAFHVKSEADIADRLEEVRKKEHSARHYCYAWKLGLDDDRYRANDDGEPANSAGKPILGQLEKHELTNTILIVVRYFGGTKLGVGGLINAYRTAASEALKDARSRKVVLKHHFALDFGYDQIGDVMAAIRSKTFTPYDQTFELNCTLKLEVPIERAAEVKPTFAGMENVSVQSLGIY